MNKYTISKAHFDPERNSGYRCYFLKCDDTPEYVIGVGVFSGYVTDISLGRVVKFDSLNGNTYDVCEEISKNFYIVTLTPDVYRSITFIRIRLAFGHTELIELMYDCEVEEVFLNGVIGIPEEQIC